MICDTRTEVHFLRGVTFLFTYWQPLEIQADWERSLICNPADHIVVVVVRSFVCLVVAVNKGGLKV